MKPETATFFVSIAILFVGCEESKDPAERNSESEPEELRIETDEGTVVGQATDVEDFPQKIVPVNAAESRQFAEWAAGGEAFLTTYGPLESENELKRYDEAFKAWQDSTTKKHSDQDVINIIGAYLGQRLAQDFDMEWVMVTDKFGQDYAVRHKTLELMSFPFSSVMKRVEDNEHDFIHGVYYILKNEVENGEWKQRPNSEQNSAGQPPTHSESQ